MRLTKKVKYDIQHCNDLIFHLSIIDHNRKSYRKLAVKLLREYYKKIDNQLIKDKINCRQFGDLVDLTVIDALEQVRDNLEKGK